MVHDARNVALPVGDTPPQQRDWVRSKNLPTRRWRNVGAAQLAVHTRTVSRKCATPTEKVPSLWPATKVPRKQRARHAADFTSEATVSDVDQLAVSQTCERTHTQLQSYAVDVMALPPLRSALSLSRTPDAVAEEPVPRRRRYDVTHIETNRTPAKPQTNSTNSPSHPRGGVNGVSANGGAATRSAGVEHLHFAAHVGAEQPRFPRHRDNLEGRHGGKGLQHGHSLRVVGAEDVVPSKVRFWAPDLRSQNQE